MNILEVLLFTNADDLTLGVLKVVKAMVTILEFYMREIADYVL